jgi:hypothetical protein
MTSKLTRKEVLQLASSELQREQSDVLAFVDKNREIVELPAGLETGFTQNRKRGARTDTDCINEICELVSQGITATAAVKYVGLPWATWQAWLKKNHENAREKFNFAYNCHLEVMADNTLRIYEQLKAEREAAMQAYHAAHKKWRQACDALREGDRRPSEPVYEGPGDWELSLADKRVKARQWHLERRHEKFAAMQVIEQRGDVTISHEIDLKRDPREAMREYLKLIDARPD